MFRKRKKLEQRIAELELKVRPDPIEISLRRRDEVLEKMEREELVRRVRQIMEHLDLVEIEQESTVLVEKEET